MSSTDESPEEIAEGSMDQAGGLGEIVPESLLPIWRRIELIQEFRATHGETYVSAMELLLGIALTAGYVWWLTLYL